MGKKVAVKRVSLSKKKGGTDPIVEVKLMSKLSHPNLVRLIDAKVLADAAEPTMEIG